MGCDADGCGWLDDVRKALDVDALVTQSEDTAWGAAVIVGTRVPGDSMSVVTQHAGLAGGRWATLTLAEQLANVGSEVGRAARAKAVRNTHRSVAALERALELFDLTLADPRWAGRRREICRAREIVCDFVLGENVHGLTEASLDAYFLPFARAARSSSTVSK